MRRSSLALAAIFGLTGCAGSVAGSGAGASDPGPLGLSVKVHMAPTILSDDFSEYTGSGIGGTLAYGFGPRAEVFLGMDVAAMEVDDEFGEGEGTADLTHLDLGLRYSFDKPGRMFVPYVLAAFSSRTLVSEFCDDFFGCIEGEASGTGVTFGPGLRVFFGDSFAADVGWSFTVGEFTDGSVDGEEVEDFEAYSAASGRFMIGASWYPSRSGEDEGGRGGGGGPIK